MTKPKKTFVLLVLFLFFSSCGYTPIFSEKDINFSVENIEFSGNKDIEEKITAKQIPDNELRKLNKKGMILGETTVVISVAVLFFAALLDVGV